MIQVTMPDYLSSRDCLLQVNCFEESYVHQSWLLPDGKVISFEDIPDNYPSGSLAIWESVDDYIDGIAEVGWINDPEYIMNYNPELEMFGFPFCELEDEEDEL